MIPLRPQSRRRVAALPTAVPLQYPPPPLEGPRVVTIDDDPTSRDIRLSPTEDCIIEAPDPVRFIQSTNDAIVRVTGGRNVVWIGGQVIADPGQQTTLAAPVEPADNVLFVADTTGFPNSGRLRVDGEAINYTGRTPTTFTGCTRRAAAPLTFTGASDQTHTDGTVVYLGEYSRIPLHVEGNSGQVHIEGLSLEGMLCAGVRIGPNGSLVTLQNIRAVSAGTSTPTTYADGGPPAGLQWVAAGLDRLRLDRCTFVAGAAAQGATISTGVGAAVTANNVEFISGSGNTVLVTSDTATVWTNSGCRVRSDTRTLAQLIPSNPELQPKFTLAAVSGLADYVPAGAAGAGYVSPGYSATTPALTVTNVTANSATLNWSEIPGATGYLVGRDGTSTTGTGPFQTTDPATAISRTFNLLQPSTVYTLYCEPQPFATRSSIAVRTLGTLGSTTVSVSGITTSTITLNWTAVTGNPTGYLVGRDGFTADGEGPVEIEVAPTVLTQRFTNLQPGTAYTLFCEPEPGGTRRIITATTTALPAGGGGYAATYSAVYGGTGGDPLTDNFTLGTTRPTAGNTGHDADLITTTLTGNQTYTTTQTVSNTVIGGNVVIESPAVVTFNNCWIQGQSTWGTPGYNGAVEVKAGARANLTNCTISPRAGGYYLTAINCGGPVDAYRCNISQAVDLIRMYSTVGGNTIRGCYLHDYVFWDGGNGTATANGPVGTTGNGTTTATSTQFPGWSTNDCILVTGGSGNRIEGCAFDETFTTTLGTPNTAINNPSGHNGGRKYPDLDYGGGVAAEPFHGVITGLQVLNNWFQHGEYGIRTNTQARGFDTGNTMTISGNRFNVDQKAGETGNPADPHTQAKITTTLGTTTFSGNVFSDDIDVPVSMRGQALVATPAVAGVTRYEVTLTTSTPVNVSVPILYGNMYGGYDLTEKQWDTRIPAEVTLVRTAGVDLAFMVELHEEVGVGLPSGGHRYFLAQLQAQDPDWALAEGKGGNHCLYRPSKYTVPAGKNTLHAQGNRWFSDFTATHKATGLVKRVVLVHFIANGTDATTGAVIDNASLRAAQANEIANYSAANPIDFFTGDFNSSTESAGFPRAIFKAAGWTGLREKGTVVNGTSSTFDPPPATGWIEDIWSRPAQPISNSRLILTNGASDHNGWLATTFAYATAGDPGTTPTTTAPTVPLGVAATATASTATITWQPPTSTGGSPITGYRVSRNGTATSGTGAYTTVVAATVRSFQMNLLYPSTAYTLTVAAINAIGEGPAASKTVTTAAAAADPGTGTPSTGNPSGQAMPTSDLTGWKLIFTDDFTTPIALGSWPGSYATKWRGYPEPWLDTSDHGMYSPGRTHSVANSMLDIWLHSEGTQRYVGAPEPKINYLTSTTKRGQTYGRYAIRMRADKMHLYKVAYLLWPDSNLNAEGEIDYPETDFDGTSIGAYSHDVNGVHSHNAYGVKVTGNLQTWHTFVIEWRPASLKFFLDGTQIGSTTLALALPKTPMHWVIQNETALGTALPALTVQGHVQIDWVAVWSYVSG